MGGGGGGGGGGSMGDIFCMPLLLQLPSVSDPAVLCSLYSASRRKDAGGKHSPNFSGACRLVRRCVLCPFPPTDYGGHFLSL